MGGASELIARSFLLYLAEAVCLMSDSLRVRRELRLDDTGRRNGGRGAREGGGRRKGKGRKEGRVW